MLTIDVDLSRYIIVRLSHALLVQDGIHFRALVSVKRKKRRTTNCQPLTLLCPRAGILLEYMSFFWNSTNTERSRTCKSRIESSFELQQHHVSPLKTSRMCVYAHACNIRSYGRLDLQISRNMLTMTPLSVRCVDGTRD